jgi:hypothetical protein
MEGNTNSHTAASPGVLPQHYTPKNHTQTAGHTMPRTDQHSTTPEDCLSANKFFCGNLFTLSPQPRCCPDTRDTSKLRRSRHRKTQRDQARPRGRERTPRLNDRKPCGTNKHCCWRPMWSSPKLELPELDVDRAGRGSLHPAPCSAVIVRVGA